MGSTLTSHLRATYDAAVKQCVEMDVANLRKCKLVNELADPKLTVVTLKVRTRSVSVTTLLSR